jgi:hypothetical protein
MIGRVFDTIKRWFSGNALPDWVTYVDGAEAVARGRPHLEGGYYEVDPDLAYPTFFRLLGFDQQAITQYHMEVARLCFTEFIYDQINGRRPISLVILRKDGRWALSAFAEGAGADKGAAQFRSYYHKVV